MVCEIEKNFLLSDCTFLDNLENNCLKNYELEIFYTKITLKHSIKFKSSSKQFYKITKLNDLILEREERISQKQYEKARKKIIGKSIKKKRFELKFPSLKAYIDIYKKPKICVLKVFFPDLNSAKQFKIPKEFKIQKEFHYNLDFKSILLYGFGYEDFNVQKYFNLIEKKQNFVLDFPAFIGAFDGFRIILFYLFEKLQFYWKLFLEKKDKKDLENLVFYMRSFYIFLSSMNTVLDQKLSDALALQFKAIIYKIQSTINSENLLLFLKKHQDLLDDLDFFIRENSFYKGHSKERFFKQLVALELRKKLIFLRKEVLNKNTLESFEQSFFASFIFLKYFHCFLKMKILNKLYKKYFSAADRNLLFKTRKKQLCKLLKKASKNLKIYKG
ncbi:hypothetical protein LNU06_01145 [Campylobacter sp. VicNov18]|uniref:hypothetical protein n=1 Tax=Campylobacter bilis TaxID=2691918 RepID=UPI00130E4FEC|nr:hypothetical protein [Campylobacter bilis]MPV63274.1 hypothetical protein [Campylobacter hepaticus]MBM0636773.1 hypothetical protein [Campylobacter bilis]MCC8277345.1 hypothetical protein [Campylobacter bilis]MCC8299088.1 hypothetical protein [Campylobacter bilis]MCC8300254.1 hypothetical protein [Campylobacter bilis]